MNAGKTYQLYDIRIYWTEICELKQILYLNSFLLERIFLQN